MEKEFGVPLWLLNASEICAWLSAQLATKPGACAKGLVGYRQGSRYRRARCVRRKLIGHAMTKVSALIQALNSNRPIKKAICLQFEIAKQYIGTKTPDGLAALTAAIAPHMGALQGAVVWDPPANEPEIRASAETLLGGLKALISGQLALATLSATTADSPRYIPRERLVDPSLLDSATAPEDAARIETHLTTLKLRLQTRLDDPRWYSFLNYASEDTKIGALSEWMELFGLGKQQGPRVSIIDLSMLSHEVLPYACTVIGRILLEARENLPAARRYKHPWVLILEEAHNYARPARSDEQRGQTLSRLAFERIAKEGRKFGLSLIIASQRPSEISQTIISQCANFISHRLQNPDDIDHFRRIIPMQARRLLDQVTILASGEAIVFGSAFHVPTRVQFDHPNPGPYSQTSAPFHEWSKETEPFPLNVVIDAWGLRPPQAVVDEIEANDAQIEIVAGSIEPATEDDEIPF